MSKIHELKIAPEHFKAVQSEEKRAEFRLNDRDFALDDMLILNEWEPENGYTGQRVTVRVTNVTDLKEWAENYVMLSIAVLKKPMSELFEVIGWKELSRKGLVFRINHEILHPLGLAVAYDNLDGISSGAIVAPDGTWKFSDSSILLAKEKGWIE
ncbi:DUF3850 domain-containing protein [Escherichia coli]